MKFHAAEFPLRASRMVADMCANDLRSLGKLCAELQAPYHVLTKAVETLGIAPALVLNGVRHFDPPAVERIAAAVITADAAPVAPRHVLPRESANDATHAAGAARSQPRASRPPSGKASRQNVRQPQGAP